VGLEYGYEGTIWIATFRLIPTQMTQTTTIDKLALLCSY